MHALWPCEVTQCSAYGCGILFPYLDRAAGTEEVEEGKICEFS